MYITRKKSAMAAASSRQVFDKRSIVGRASLVAATLSVTSQAVLTDLMKQTGDDSPRISDYNSVGSSDVYWDYDIETTYP